MPYSNHSHTAINQISCRLTISSSVTHNEFLSEKELDPNWFRPLWNAIKTIVLISLTQPAITCSKLTIKTLEEGVKYVQS